MTLDDYAKLLGQARRVLERYMFDGVDLRDDIAEVCADIDEALPAPADAHKPRQLHGIERAA